MSRVSQARLSLKNHWLILVDIPETTELVVIQCYSWVVVSICWVFSTHKTSQDHTRHCRDFAERIIFTNVAIGGLFESFWNIFYVLPRTKLWGYPLLFNSVRKWFMFGKTKYTYPAWFELGSSRSSIVIVVVLFHWVGLSELNIFSRPDFFPVDIRSSCYLSLLSDLPILGSKSTVFSETVCPHWGVLTVRVKAGAWSGCLLWAWAFFLQISVQSGSCDGFGRRHFSVHFCIKWLLWNVDMHFHCAGSLCAPGGLAKTPSRYLCWDLSMGSLPEILPTELW